MGGVHTYQNGCYVVLFYTKFLFSAETCFLFLRSPLAHFSHSLFCNFLAPVVFSLISAGNVSTWIKKAIEDQLGVSANFGPFFMSVLRGKVVSCLN